MHACVTMMRMHLGSALLLGMAMAQLGSGADAGYLDPAVCAGCHRQIAEEYARTAMGRSFRPAGAGAGLSEFDGSKLDHLESRERFTAERRDGKYYVRRFQTGPDGKDRNSREVRVDYIIGSGNRARSYLHRTSSNRLVEFPVTWYPENGGHWGMSPAYDRPGHPGFSREIPYRCMFCHNGYPEIEQRAAEWEGASEFPSRLPEGIDCQRCHGPGRSHVEAARKGSGSEAVRRAIVNPARLGPERQLEVCMQCHLETTSMELPGAVMRHAREVELAPGQSMEHKDLEITAVAARHDGRRGVFDRTWRSAIGYIVKCAQASVYYAGDTAYFSGFEEIGRRLHPDVALLPIAGYEPPSQRADHMSPLDALQAFQDLGAKLLVPVAYGEFPLGYEPLDEPLTWLARLCRERGLGERLVVLRPGETCQVHGRPLEGPATPDRP